MTGANHASQAAAADYVLSEADLRAVERLLEAELLTARGLLAPAATALALQRCWDTPDAAANFLSEAAQIGRLEDAQIDAIRNEAQRILAAVRRDGGALPTRVLSQHRAGAEVILPQTPPERYIDLSAIGAGGMGIVYAAVDTELNRQVALKLIRTASSIREAPSLAELLPASMGSEAATASPDLRTRLLQEAWITGGLEHPGIVPVYEIGQTLHGLPYYAMRLVRGRRTLKEAMAAVRDAPLEQRLELLEPFLKLCDAVSYAHDRGVIHRDIKPENVALGEFGEVALLDWGLAMVIGESDDGASRWQERVQELRETLDLRTLADCGGTPGYIAPEAASAGRARVDERSDVYGLGAILYELLTGHLPHDVQGPFAEYVARLQSEDVPPVSDLAPDVPKGLEVICADALARAPDSRIQHVTVLADSVRNWKSARTRQREVDGLLREARRALEAAGAVQGADRTAPLDQAAAALVRVVALDAAPMRRRALLGKVDQLRRLAFEEESRARGRLLQLRAGAAAILFVSLCSLAALYVLGRERARADRAHAALAVPKRLEEVHDLLEAASELTIHPDSVPALLEWLERARGVLAFRSEDELALKQLEEGQSLPDLIATRRRRRLALVKQFYAARRDPPKDVLKLIEVTQRTLPEQKGQAILRPEHGGRQLLSTYQRGLLRGYAQLEDRTQTREDLVSEMQWRLEVARSIAESDDHVGAEAWRACSDSIREVPGFEGLHLAPQSGLVPLGRDPHSGLLEFAHVASGSIPTRSPESGVLDYAEDACIVFVLVPGGEAMLGCQATDPSAALYSEGCGVRSHQPPHAVRLSPFLLAKHELTQAQWATLTHGQTPSDIGPGKKWQELLENEALRITLRHPVESVTYHAVRETLGLHGLRVPLEAEWEYACRAGTTTRTFAGPDPRALIGCANLRGTDAQGTPLDGYPLHAPVGHFRPNAFGLHDMEGNVEEWCSSVRPPGTASPPNGEPSVRRGTNFMNPIDAAGSAARTESPPNSAFRAFGARAARSLDP